VRKVFPRNNSARVRLIVRQPSSASLRCCGSSVFNQPTTVKKKIQKMRPQADIERDIKGLPGKDLIDKCKDEHCKYYRSAGCSDNCARGEYGNPDCHYEFATEEERLLHNPIIKTENDGQGKRKYTKSEKPKTTEEYQKKTITPDKTVEELNKLFAESQKLFAEWIDLKKQPAAIKASDLIEVFNSGKSSNAFETLMDLCKAKGIEIIIRPVTK
jgi:hypothetical protein